MLFDETMTYDMTKHDGRRAALGRPGSWPDIIADLDSLTETEIAQDGKRFIVRSAPRPAASLAIRAAGVALALLHRERHERRRIVEHQFAHQLVGAFAHAQDIQQPPRLQLCHNVMIV